MLKPGSVLATLAMLLAACAGPAASPTRAPVASPTATATQAASPTATASPTSSPAESPSPTGAVESPSPSPSPSPTPPPGAVEGTLTIWADNVRAPILQDVGADFTASEFGVPVQVYEIGFGDIRDRLAQQGPAGEGPDIIIGAHDWLGQLVQAGVLEPLDLGEKTAEFEQVGLDAFTADGTLYGMPYVSEAVALYYNKDLVPTPPATWDELKQMATDLQADASLGIEQAFCMQRGDPYHTYPILTGFGGYIFGENADGTYNPEDVGLDSPGGLAFASELDALVKAGLLRDNIDYAACTTLMTTGKAAFWITGPWALNDFNTSGINYGVAPIPTMVQQPRPFVGVQGFMVSSFAPNKLLAQTFLTEFIATDETMRTLWEADPRLPVWKNLAAEMTDPNIQAFTQSMAGGDPMPGIPQMSDVFRVWGDAINLVFAQSQDAEQAFMDAATEIRGIIGQ